MKRFKKLFCLFILSIALLIGGCTTGGGDKSGKTEEEILKEVQAAFEKLDKQDLIIDRTDETDDPITKLTILTVNDFHGALEETEDGAGVARLGQYIVDTYNENPNGTIIVSAGDMFQGTGVSNYRHGRDVVKAMNAIGFDAMAIGNHEFDWSLEEILKFVDGDASNGEANFPFLSCNIAQKSKDGNLPDKVLPYRIINKGDLKVGIIGFIGYGIESDIATAHVSDYEFLLPAPVVAKYAKELREEQNCDIVIAVGHDDNATTNNSLANLTGSSRIDAIVNGHLHSAKTGLLTSTDQRDVPYVQAGHSGQYVGEITLNIENKTVQSTAVKNNKMRQVVGQNQVLVDYVTKLVKATSPIFKRVLVKTGSEIDRYACMDWAVDALHEYTGTDIAFINTGGIRSAAFPIASGQNVDVAKVYQIMPFDNTVKTVKLKGEYIESLCNVSSFVTSSNVKVDGSSIRINGELLDLDKIYYVAAIDYIFDSPSYPFLLGDEIVATGVLFRDVLIEALEEIGNSNKTWRL